MVLPQTWDELKTVGNSCLKAQLLRCIHVIVNLLCAKDSAADRPTNV